MAETIIDLTVQDRLRVNLANGNFVEIAGVNMVRVVDVGEGAQSDPPELRLASRQGGGKISAGIYRPDGGEIELGILNFKKDERDRDAGTPDAECGGEITLHLKARGPDSHGDSGMVKLIELRSDSPFNFGMGGSPAADRLVSANKQYSAVMQDDGNFVVYGVVGAWKAFWSWLTGKL